MNKKDVMITNYETRKRTCMLCMAMVCVFTCMYTVAPFAFADNGAAMINGIVQIASKIALVVGVIFGLIGILKFAVSHANEDGPAQQKAAMMMVTAVVLGILGGTKFLGIDFASWLG